MRAELVVRGLVVDAQRTPIDGATVELSGESGLRPIQLVTTTPANGTFTFAVDRVLWSKLRIIAGAPGFAPSCVEGIEDAGSSADIGWVTLLQPGSVTAEVVDDEGKPIEGARVSAAPRWAYPENVAWMFNTPRADFTRTGLTDRNGKVVIEGLPVTFVDVKAEAPGFVGNVLAAFRPMSGESQRARIPLERSRRQSGIVADRAGKPIEGARLRVITKLRGFGPSCEHARSDASGRYAIAIPARSTEHFQLVASHPGFEDVVFGQLGSIPTNGEIVLDRTLTFHVTVRRASEKAIPTIYYLPYRLGDESQEYRESAIWAFESQVLAPNSWIATTTDGIRAKWFEITAVCREGGSASFPRANSPADLSRPVEIHLELPARGSISGRVLRSGASPVANAKVLFRRESSSIPSITVSDPNGRFRIEGVEPESGWIMCFSSDGESDRTPVTVRPGMETTAVDLVLERGVPLDGHFTVSNGRPARPVDFAVFRISGEGPGEYLTIRQAAVTQNDGRFESLPLRPGRYLVTADEGPIHETRSQRLTRAVRMLDHHIPMITGAHGGSFVVVVPPDATAPIPFTADLRAAPQTRIRGAIMRNGRPWGGASVTLERVYSNPGLEIELDRVFPITVQTDERGGYVFDRILMGAYWVVLESEASRPMKFAEVLVGEEAVVDFEL